MLDCKYLTPPLPLQTKQTGYSADGRRYSLLEYVLRETEHLHGKVRRYTSPDQHAFYPDSLPPLVLPPLRYPTVLAAAADAINFNDRVMDAYKQAVLPAVAAPGDDGNYGSAATLDVLALQALSTRIHYGMFVAEAKFTAQPDAYGALIRAADAEGLMALLTDEAVEHKVAERVRRKAATFGQDIGFDAAFDGAFVVVCCMCDPMKQRAPSMHSSPPNKQRDNTQQIKKRPRQLQGAARRARGDLPRPRDAAYQGGAGRLSAAPPRRRVMCVG